MLHTHLLGREIVLRHIRNGKELRPLDMNIAYDFNYQQSTPFNDHIEILPGDELIVECVYDSTERDGMTYNGESTMEEMCLSYLMVYPKPNLGSCVSGYPAVLNPDNGEWVGDVSVFFEQAEINGYYDPDTDFYDVNVDGALEFYQQFVTEGNRLQLCPDNKGAPLSAAFGVHPALRPDIDYDSFDDDEYYVCNAEETEEPELIDTTTTFEPNTDTTLAPNANTTLTTTNDELLDTTTTTDTTTLEPNTDTTLESDDDEKEDIDCHKKGKGKKDDKPNRDYSIPIF